MSENGLATDSHGLTRKKRIHGHDPVFGGYEFWNSAKPGNDPALLCTNLQATTVPTVTSNPPNRSPWNERHSLCI
jgi:hypothetical protein